MILRYFSIFFIAGATLVAFQNCAGPDSGFSADSTSLASSEVRGLGSSGPSNTVNPDSSSLVTSSSWGFGGSSEALSIIAWSSGQAQTDCSQNGSFLMMRVENAPSNILTCAEFVLDMPAGHPRKNEQYFCDLPGKFKEPDSSWTYDSAVRVWRTVEEPYPVTNSSFIVPGTYWLVVKDQTGAIHRSNAIKIARKDSGNCLQSSSSGVVSSGGGAVAACRWSGIVAGPEAVPTQTCNQSVAGSVAKNNRGTTFTCVCN